MKFRFLNKTIENQRFNFNPRYYDARKERIDQLKDLYNEDSETEAGSTLHKERMRDNMKQSWSRTDTRKSHNKSSNIRVLVLIAILLIIGYFVFNGFGGDTPVVKKIW